jgi:hypothetical protein
MAPRFLAEIHLFATQDDGRVGGLVSGEWRTIFGVGAENWSARLMFEGNPLPGDTFQAWVQMLVPEAYQVLPVGTEFTVWENGTKGKGRVLRAVA